MNRKTFSGLADLPPLARRRFLKRMGLALAVPGVPAALRFAVNELCGGKAYAAAAETTLPTYFIEFNYRDQVDWGQVAVAPGLVSAYGSLVRGDTGRKAALFFDQAQFIKGPNNFFLTPDSQALLPHLDTLAFIDSAELTPGAIHGHNGANRNRAPDCSTTAKPGQSPMWTRDPTTQFPTGVEPYQSAIPTPASLHNYYQKVLTPGTRNGVVFKGVTRAKHTVFHFGANLPGSEMDRMQEKAQLYSAFPNAGTPAAAGVLAKPDEVELMARVLKRLDPALLQRRRYAKSAVDDHLAEMKEAQGLLAGIGSGQPIPGMTVPLTPAEEAYWKADVPEQAQNGVTVFAGIRQEPDNLTHIRFQIWEQFALAYKLIAGGFTRTVAGDTEFIDHHDSRPAANVRCQTLQVAPSLARLIEKLKAANLYDRTVIALYTCDGSRSIAANSQGLDDTAKMSVMLAGGGIKGGYYGDITVGGKDGDGQMYQIHMPDPVTGLPVPTGSSKAYVGRIPGSVVWRTVAKAMRIPDTLVKTFPLVADASPMDFMLRA